MTAGDRRTLALRLGRGLAAGAVGGILFRLAELPLPWMMGATFATIAVGAAGFPSYLPRPLRTAIIPVLGVTFGAHFETGFLAEPGRVLLLLPFVLAYLAVTVSVGWLYFRRVGGLDTASAYFAAVPGSFSQMVVVAEEARADIASIAVVHSARLVLALAALSLGLQLTLHIDPRAGTGAAAEAVSIGDIVIWLGCAVAGYAAGSALRLPTPQLFGPMILAAIAHLTGVLESSPPPWLVAGAQVGLGVYIGQQFAGVSFLAVRRLILVSAFWSLLLVLIGLAFGTLASLVAGIPVVTGLLAFSPGGAVEISVVALAAGVDLGLVNLVQFCRIFLTVLLAPKLLRLVDPTQPNRH